MKKVIIYVFTVFFLYFTLTIYSACAQGPDDNNLPGKIQYGTPGHPWIDAFNFFARSDPGLRKIYSPLYKNAAAACEIITDVPALNPPRGFNINPFVGPAGIQPLKNSYLHGLQITFANYPLYTDKKTHQVKQSRNWSSGLDLYVNDAHMLIDYNRYLLDACDSAGVAPIYFKPKIQKDNKGGLIISGIKTLQKIRVIKKKGVPLYIPVTQKEYLEFEIKWAKNALANTKRTLEYSKNILKQNENSSDVKSLEDGVKAWENNVTSSIKTIRDYQNQLSVMPEEQLNKPANTTYYFSSPKNHFNYDLVSPDYKGATEMVRFNPQYFDKDIPKSDVQLMLVATEYSSRFTPPDIIQKIKEWFGQIDYEQLQRMIL